MARAYLDQVARSNGLAPERLAATRTALARAEGLSGVQRREALLQLATQLDGDAQGAPGRLRTLAAEVRDLAGAGAGAGRGRTAELLASLIYGVPLSEWRTDQGANQRAGGRCADRDDCGATRTLSREIGRASCRERV